VVILEEKAEYDNQNEDEESFSQVVVLLSGMNGSLINTNYDLEI